MVEQVFQPGVYYIGDPSYVIDETLWERWCSNLDWANREWAFSFLGENVACGRTSDGSGVYEGYSVDSGAIGIVPHTLISDSNRNEGNLNFLGVLEKFTEPFVVKIDNGFFRFGHLQIDTDIEEDNENIEEEAEELEEDGWFDPPSNEAPR